jgi:hypothetical protein
MQSSTASACKADEKSCFWTMPGRTFSLSELNQQIEGGVARVHFLLLGAYATCAVMLELATTTSTAMQQNLCFALTWG